MKSQDFDFVEMFRPNIWKEYTIQVISENSESLTDFITRKSIRSLTQPTVYPIGIDHNQWRH